MDRTTTTEGTLARLGFGDPHRAAETLDAWFAEFGTGCGALADQVTAAADPAPTLKGLTPLDAARDGSGYATRTGTSLTLDMAPAGQPAQQVNIVAGLKWMGRVWWWR